jgi:hypothetical protein
MLLRRLLVLSVHATKLPSASKEIRSTASMFLQGCGLCRSNNLRSGTSLIARNLKACHQCRSQEHGHSTAKELHGCCKSDDYVVRIPETTTWSAKRGKTSFSVSDDIPIAKRSASCGILLAHITTVKHDDMDRRTSFTVLVTVDSKDKHIIQKAINLAV